MKKLTFLMVGLFAANLCGQIRVDDSSYSVEQLITDVLIASPCAETSNYSWLTGTSIGVNGIGYFDAANTSFPFREGVVLSTGSARDARGPNRDIKDSGSEWWPGDAELRAIAQSGDLFNASYIEFTFVPRTARIAFDFLFASEEYIENFQCAFSDVFAFILTDSQGVSTNLAVIPSSNIPVSVTTIRPGVIDQCPASNVEFFDKINGGDSPISYAGQTHPLTAESDVIPGESYRIKLVIADNLDHQLDSAVFLEAGSFVLDIDLGEDRTVLNGNPACDGEAVLLDTQAVGIDALSWFKDGTELISHRGSPTLEVVESGTYMVEVVYPGNCESSDTIEIEFVPPPFIASPPQALVQCDQDKDGKERFDFSVNERLILGQQSSDLNQITFHTSIEDAREGIRAIANGTDFESGPEGTTIYARIASGRECYSVSQFELIVRPNLDEPDLEAEYILCLDRFGRVIGDPPLLDTGLPAMGFTYAWYKGSLAEENKINGATGPTFTATEDGTYHVTWQREGLECGFSTNTVVRASQEPGIFEVVIRSDLFDDNNKAEILVEGNGAYEYRMDDGPFVGSTFFENLAPGEHIAQVRDLEGCSTLTKHFLIVDYPRVFTPNGDTMNDTWTIVGLENIQGPNVSICDRFGTLLHYFEEEGEWDGTFNGQPLPSSDYWFRLRYQTGNAVEEFVGHFALKR